MGRICIKSTKGVTTILASRKEIKKKAREILFTEYRIFLFATLFFAAVSFGFTMLSKTFCELICLGISDEIYTMVSLTFDIIILAVTFPFMLGYISLCTDIAVGKQTELSQLFALYSGKETLLRCYSFLLVKIPEVLLKIALPFTAVFLVRGFFEAYIVTDGYDLYIDAMFFILLIVVAFAVFYMSGGILISVFDFCRGTKKKYSKKEKQAFFATRLSLIPLYVLSVLTFGVLFIAYTFPFTLTVYALYTEKYENKRPKRYSGIAVDTAVFESIEADAVRSDTDNLI